MDVLEGSVRDSSLRMDNVYIYLLKIYECDTITTDIFCLLLRVSLHSMFHVPEDDTDIHTSELGKHLVDWPHSPCQIRQT